METDNFDLFWDCLLFDHSFIASIPVVGAKEQETGTVNVRTRDNKIHNEHPVEFVIERFKYLCNNKALDAEDRFIE